MDYDTFVGRVQELAGIEARQEAEAAISATLEVLAERLERALRDHLASQLPGELREHLNRRQYDRPFLLDAFYSRVGSRAELRRPASVARSRAVVAALREAVSTGEWEHWTSGLSPDYAELLGTPPGRAEGTAT